MLPNVKIVLEAKKHPNPSLADKGMTLYNYVTWMFDNAGNAGMIKVSKMVEKAQEETESLFSNI